MLTLALAGDLRPVLDDDRRSLRFDGAGGRAALRYGGLVATDARGHSLRARLSLRGTTLRVAVDVQGARYPLRVDPFIQAAELTASDGATGDELGDSVAISGTTIAVGAPQHTVAGHQGQGAVYVFSEPASGGWRNARQTAELTASDGTAGDELGYSVAISGSTIAAGAPAHGSGGAVYVFSQPTSGRWRSATQTAELTASDGSVGDELGDSVGASGPTIAAGAPEHTVAARGGQGAVYMFSEPTSGGWRNTKQTAELTASDGAAGDELGYSVAISGGTVAGTAIGHATFGPRGRRGGVRVLGAFLGWVEKRHADGRADRVRRRRGRRARRLGGDLGSDDRRRLHAPYGRCQQRARGGLRFLRAGLRADGGTPCRPPS